MGKGLVHVYTGDGKGKTTAAFGLALRALGRGLSVCVIQFLKGQESGEVLALKKFSNATVRQFGREGFVDLESPSKEDKQFAKEGFDFAREIIDSGDFDLVVLDEINLAVAANLIKLQDILNLIKSRSSSVEVVLTGRKALPEVIDVAGYVTEFKNLKHPFDEGKKAREGVEF